MQAIDLSIPAFIDQKAGILFANDIKAIQNRQKLSNLFQDQVKVKTSLMREEWN